MIRNMLQIDRLIILLISICLIILLVTSGVVKTWSIGIIIILCVVLFIRWIMYSIRISQKRNPDCQKGHHALFMMKQLAAEMHVKLHTVKPLEIAPGYVGAKSDSLTFFSGSIFSYSGRVVIGCPILCHLDDLSLKGVLAHELAHIKKHHTLKMLFLNLFLVFMVLIIWVFLYNSPIIATSLTLICLLVFSGFMWIFEYEADATAADCVGGGKYGTCIRTSKNYY